MAFAGGTIAITSLTGGTGTTLLVDGATANLTAATLAGNFEVTNGTVNLAGDLTASGQLLANGGFISIAAGKTLRENGGGNLDNGAIGGAGTLQTYGNITLDQDSTVYLDDTVVWSNAGTVNSAGSVLLNYPYSDGTATIKNTASATFNFTTDSSAISFYGSPTGIVLSNAGTLGKTGGTGTSNIYVSVASTGTINVASGTLEFDGGGTIGGAIIGTGTVAFGGGGNPTLAATGITGFGQASLLLDGAIVNFNTVTLAGSFTETAGSANFAGNATLAMGLAGTGGTIGIASGKTLTANGTSTLDNLTIDGPGTFVTNGTVTLDSGTEANLDGGLVWNNNGTVGVGSDLYLNYPSFSGTVTINNAAAGIINFQSDQSLYVYGQGSGILTNAGVFGKTGGTSTSNVFAQVTNTGTLLAASGILELDSGGTIGGTITGVGTIAFGGGTFDATGVAGFGQSGVLVDGGTVSFGGGTITGNFTETAGGANFVGSAALANGLNLQAGELSAAAGVTISVNGANLTNNSSLDGPGTIATSGTVSVGGLFLDGSVTWANNGTVTDSNTVYFGYPSGSGASAIQNLAGGVFNLTSAGQLLADPYSTGATFANAGTLAKTGGGTGITNVAVSVVNSGILTASVGTLELDSGATLDGTIGATNGAGLVLLASGGFNTDATATIADDGATGNGLTLASGETWTVTGTVNDAGRVTLGNATSAGTYATLAIAAGGTWNLTGNDAYISTRYSTALTNAGTIAKTGGTGTGTILSAITNTGTINASAGTLVIGYTLSGNGALRIGGGATLELARALPTTQSVGFTGAGSTLKLDAPASIALLQNYGAGDVIDLAGVTLTSATISNKTLTVSTGSSNYSFTSSASLVGDKAVLASDGGGGTRVTLYAQAAAAHNPEPVAFGHVHVGDTVSQALTVTNSGTPTGYTEALNASLGGATSGFTASGTVSGIASGQRSSAFTVGLYTSTAGTYSGTATLSLASNGAGIDGAGTTALASQTVTTNGAVYAYAAPSLASSSLNLGAARVGGALSGSDVLGNGTAASAYQESLVYGTPSVSSGLTVTNGAGTVAAGGTTALGLALNTGTAGTVSGTASLALTSTGVGTSGLADTALAGQTVSAVGTVYATAVAQLSGSSVSFGIVHVGDTISQGLTVTNAPSGALTDVLTAGTASTGGTSTAAYQLGSGLSAGQSGIVSLSLNTTGAGTISGTATVGFNSHDAALADLALNPSTVAVSGVVDNYAVAQVESVSGTGTLAGSGTNLTVNLGTIAQNGSAASFGLGVLNGVAGPADLLGGSFALSNTSGFTNTGFTSFSGLTAGQDERNQVVTLSTSAAGVFSETILLSATGSNASGYSGALAGETITVTGTVVGNGGSVYNLTAAPTTITGSAGDDVFNATGGVLNSRDIIDGGAGNNTLNLVGGGYFDLGAPRTLTNIQNVTAQESAGGTTIYTRNSINMAYTVTPGGSGSLTIYGGIDSDSFALGSGNDTVVLGSTTETVTGGTGTGLVQGTLYDAGNLVKGSSSSTPLTFELTTGGFGTLNSGDSNLVVKLDASSNLSLGAATFITAVGAAAGHDTLTAGGANQTLQSIGGSDVLVGSSAYGDIFSGTQAGFTGDVIKNFGGTDLIDFTDISFANFKSLAYSTASGLMLISDKTHSDKVSLYNGTTYSLSNFTTSSDGHGGTYVAFVTH